MKIECISMKMILESPIQPRKKMDEHKMKELTESIETVGMKVPIIVRPKGKKYEIISGHRRWEAAKEAKLKEVTVLVKEIDDTEFAVETLIGNEFREDLDPWDRAEFLLYIMEKTKCKTYAELGKLVGMSKEAINFAMRYLNIDEEVREKIGHDRLSHRTAVEIGTIPDKETQRKVADIAIKKDMTLKETQDMVSTIKKAPEPLSRAIIEEKVDAEDVAPVVDYGISDEMVEPAIQEFAQRKQEREAMKKLTQETDRAVITGQRTPVAVKVDRTADEKRLNRFIDTRNTVKWWTVTAVNMIKDLPMRDQAIGYIKEIRDHCTDLLVKLQEE